MGFSFSEKLSASQAENLNNIITKGSNQRSKSSRNAIRLKFMFTEFNFKLAKVWRDQNAEEKSWRSFLQSIPVHMEEMKNNCFGKGYAKTTLNNDSSRSIGVLQFKNHKGKSIDKAKEFNLDLCVAMLLDFCLHFTPMNKSLENRDKTGNDKFVFRLPDLNDMFSLKGFFSDEREGFQRNLSFARVNGAPLVVKGHKEEGESERSPSPTDDSAGVKGSNEGVIDYSHARKNIAADAQKLGSDIVSFSMENAKKLESVLSAMSLADLMALDPRNESSDKDHPDKNRLCLVQDFFKYTRIEGRRFFDELDRDSDGKLTLEDLEVAMRKRRLPKKYAIEFIHRTRRHIFSKSIDWKQFLSLMEQKEVAVLQAYTDLCLNKSGTLQKNQVLKALKKAGLPASEGNFAAMMHNVDADAEGFISYGHFHNFMLLLPPKRLEDVVRSLRLEAATVATIAPPIPISKEDGSVLASALAGGLSCAFSTILMHPLDTLKTQVQASTLSFPVILSKIPEIGVRGLYRGSIPAIAGQFSSHGLRTGFSEVVRMLLENTCPEFSDIQTESMSSFVGTCLGTVMRIPCEVLKQRMQAGNFDSLGAAVFATWEKDGWQGFFRGTGLTLCREVPFYVAGTALYTQSIKVAQKLVKRELAPWEALVVGAIAGGLAATTTTPFDVLKTRMMTTTPGVPVTMLDIAFAIWQQEGPLGFFKGVVPRFFWVAPLGAINLAGYELAKKIIVTEQQNIC